MKYMILSNDMKYMQACKLISELVDDILDFLSVDIFLGCSIHLLFNPYKL